MTSSPLPPCGLYRTLAAVGGVPAGRLVYFHNHGEPGPGLYLPKRWEHNRAVFAPRGQTLPSPDAVRHLAPLPAEGFYRVRTSFHCCVKRCQHFVEEDLVQLGYDREARSILFRPRLAGGSIGVPERGTRVDPDLLDRLVPLRVQSAARDRHDRQEEGPDWLH